MRISPPRNPGLRPGLPQRGPSGLRGREKEAREIVRVLLAAGADPSIANKSGKKPADYAADEAVKALLTGHRSRRQVTAEPQQQ